MQFNRDVKTKNLVYKHIKKLKLYN